MFIYISVTKLGIEDIRIEIKVSAYNEESAEVSRKARAKKSSDQTVVDLYIDTK